METSGNAVEKFLKVKTAVAAEITTKTIQKTGLRSMFGFYRDWLPDYRDSEQFRKRKKLLTVPVIP